MGDKMNVYDFDKTIYVNDSTLDFYKYCIKKYPLMLIEVFPLIITGVLYLLKIMSKTQAKEVFYRFLRYVPHIDDEVVRFWDLHSDGIKSWYLEQQQDTDVIISASPEFLLRPICNRLGIKHLIASRINKHTGKTTGENCYGAEKVVRFKDSDCYGEVDKFYSDSYSDDPLAKLATTSFLVNGDELLPW